jgi:hypothetical protein
MTVMQDSEKRFNLYLSGGLAVLGLVLWIFGLLAVAKAFFLPDYAAMLRGSGGVLLLFGLTWLMLAAIRSMDALINLMASFLLALPGMCLWLTGAWLTSLPATSAYAPFAAGYAAPFSLAGRNAVLLGVIWLVVALGKLIATPTIKKVK